MKHATNDEVSKTCMKGKEKMQREQQREQQQREQQQREQLPGITAENEKAAPLYTIHIHSPPPEQYLSRRSRNSDGGGAAMAAQSSQRFSRRRRNFPLALSSGTALTALTVFVMMLTIDSATAQTTIPDLTEVLPSQSQRPSQSPSDLPTLLPSSAPSLIPSAVPSTNPPTFIPSSVPTPVPTTSMVPSSGPSEAPSTIPTRTAYPSSSKRPSQVPSIPPSQLPSHPPSMVPSVVPTNTFLPSNAPSWSASPSNLPTESPAPTASPSSVPTVTPRPTGLPSIIPTQLPSPLPSETPSIAPTFGQTFVSNAFYFQSFIVANGRVFNETESLAFEATMEGYTQNISTLSESTTLGSWTRINASCAIITQRFVSGRRRMQKVGGSLRRRLDDPGVEDLTDAPTAPPEVPQNFVDYTMTWESIHVNVSNYSTYFVEFINANREVVAIDLQKNGVNVTSVDRLRIIQTSEAPSTIPTASGMPSISPSRFPSAAPSMFPSLEPSVEPSDAPSTVPSTTPSSLPTRGPQGFTLAPNPITPSPTSAPTGGGINTTIIVVVVVALILVALAAAFLFVRRRQHKRELAFQTAAAAGSGTAVANDNIQVDRRPDRFSRLSVKTDPYGSRRENNGETPRSDDHAAGMISPSESLLSNQSLLSAGNSMGVDSIEEADGTHHLADEFDQYKDQNLEKMRTDVEETVTGADGMMSHALTLALMGDEDPVADQKELYWGGSGDATEIEASALCEVNDFLKRKEGAGIAERRTFMQDTMNKMVASVRHGVMKPEEASRTIHECAAMLGLELASDIPENTVIVTGLRKNVTKADLEVAFREFGDIDEMAVASMGRGLGFVRFMSPASVQRTMKKFREKEIVVQDVAVMVKVLKADGTPF